MQVNIIDEYDHITEILKIATPFKLKLTEFDSANMIVQISEPLLIFRIYFTSFYLIYYIHSI